MRVKSSTTTRSKRRRLFKKTKGMIKVRRASVRKAKEAVLKAEAYAYRDRRNKKRTFRALWITRLNGALRTEGVTYSRFMKQLKDNKIELDRQMLSEIAINHPESLSALIKQVAPKSTP